MKNRDLDIAEKAQKMFRDIDSIVREEEGVELDALSDSGIEVLSEVKERLDNPERREMVYSALAQLDSASGLQRTKTKLRRKQRKHQLRRVLTTATSIAAAVLFITFNVYNQFKTQDPKEEVILAQDFSHNNISVPTLVTSKGMTYDIDPVNMLSMQMVDDEDDIVIQKEGNRISYMMNEESVSSEMKYHDLIVPQQYTSSLELADGTKITVNAGSTLHFPVQFTDSIREVTLSGEAFFEVAKSDKPFIVHVNDMSVKVYGTKFNINTLNDKIETVLVEGSVGVSAQGGEEMRMRPNQLLVYSHNEKKSSMSLRDIDVNDYVAWLSSDFQYRKRPVSSILKDVSRWYGIQINYSELIKLDELNISLYAPRDEELNEVLDLIEMGANVKFINEGGKVYTIK